MARFMASIRRPSKPRVHRLSHKFLAVSIGTYDNTVSVDVNRSGADYEVFTFTLSGNVMTGGSGMLLYNTFQLSGNDITDIVSGKKRIVLVDGGANENKNVL